MGGHIIAAFKGVRIIWLIFFHQIIQGVFKIYPNTRVSIFINGERCRCMFDENVKDSCFWKFRKLVLNNWVNQVIASRFCT